ncbi:hypothetical protein [Absidia glauca]|uniref:Uncharacterized protein n=1 Tax=Absidia glauca TaxID=4829 RepID=A0A163IPY0_ABSGL|nr:hypothetical protein [Absidia glauca]
MSTWQVYRLLMEYCSCLDNKTPNAFAKWCSSRKIKFLQADYFRKRPKHCDEGTGRYRSIYVMKKEYLGDIVRKITN